MKTQTAMIMGTIITLLAASRLTAMAMPVVPEIGPNPYGLQTPAVKGQLEVFSRLEGHSEGNNPSWYQHADYYVYDTMGYEVSHVHNIVGYYEQAPRVVSLPAGEYVIKAPAKGTFWLEVPVTVKDGAITKVHLDGDWRAPVNTPGAQVVFAPTGYPVGWRAER